MTDEHFSAPSAHNISRAAQSVTHSAPVDFFSAAPSLPRALPLLPSASAASVSDVRSWHRSVLSASTDSSPALRRDVLFVSAVAVFACLLFAAHRLACRWRGESTFGRLWREWSAVQRLEWLSYALSTLHALLASAASCVALLHSLLRLHAEAASGGDEQSVWPAAVWFVRTSLHPLLPAQSAERAAEAEAAFDLALSCAFSASAVRDTALVVTAAYLLVDLTLCLASTTLAQPALRHTQTAGTVDQPHGSRRAQLATPLTLLHHTLILLAFAWSVHTHTGTLYCCFLLLNELSTPFLNLNYALSALSLSSSYPRLYVCNAAVLLLLFLLVRLLGNALLLGHVFLFSWAELQPLWRSDSRWLLPPHVRLRCAVLSALCCGHVAINAVWAVQLARAVHRKWSKAAAHSDTRGVSGKSKQL